MTDHDFTTAVDRTGTGSAKWDAMLEANPAVPAGIHPLSVADTDLPIAPEIVGGLRTFLDTAILGYTRQRPSYTQAVVDWMARRHGWTIDSEWIHLAPGVVPAIFAAVRAFTAPGEGVIVQTPTYYPFRRAVDLTERTFAANPLVIRDGRYEIDIEGLERLAQHPDNKVLLLCSPHNPTGRVWTRDELEQIGRIVVENDLVLISDEIHFDLVRPGVVHTVAATISDAVAQRAVICTAPSKSFNLAGMATSNIIIPNAELGERFAAQMEATGFFTLNTLGFEACELAYTKGAAWLDGLVALVARNHDLVVEFFAEHFPACTVFPLEGTYLQWLDMRPLGLSAEELERRNTQEAYLFFDEGTIFGDDGAGFERMNLAAPTAVIRAALERMANAYAGH